MISVIDPSTAQDLVLSGLSFLAGVGVGAIAAIHHFKARRNGQRRFG